jgi:hypothetical protein
MEITNWIIIGVVLIVVIIGVSILSHLSGQLDSTGEVRKDNSLLKLSQGVKNGFLFLFFFTIGTFIFYYSGKDIYENYRIRNDSVMVVGKVQSSKYFKDRRGTRKRKRTVTGYKIDVKFYDSGLEKRKTFEVQNSVEEGTEVKIYHVPGTNISSLDGYPDLGSFISVILGLGIMIWGGMFGVQLIPKPEETQHF